MSKSVLELTDGTHLEQFVIQIKNVKTPAALTPIIKQALSAPNVFVFGELLAMENVKQLANAEEEHKKTFELLELFAYGTYPEYQARVSSLPKLTDPQVKKLKQLTIVSLASKNRVIPYDGLLKQLDIPNVRALEDIIIDSIYQGLLDGKLDQQRGQLEVDMVIGRDLRAEEYDKLTSTLNAWCDQSKDLLKAIREKIDWAKSYQEKQKAHKQDFEKKMDNIKSTIKAAMEADMMNSAKFEGAEYSAFEEHRRPQAKGRKGNKMKGAKTDQRHRGRNM
eukprot:TRINITY_DN721_c1_g1_i1.p1 TRINITY_DN721_c1_g1~~TRINITY_DN721_c1_g1_i1.p1  ORF type:complete len:291 (+),score=61.95 TRINITY_DN721_c1_g1_i1:40-873(+)